MELDGHLGRIEFAPDFLIRSAARYAGERLTFARAQESDPSRAFESAAEPMGLFAYAADTTAIGLASSKTPSD
jgi:hypothetical protein